MTAKGKAKELIHKFSDANFGVPVGGWVIYPEESKKCALICCDEIIDLDSGDSVDQDYWEEVKEEIKKQ
jgi:hypothetical protein